MAAGVVGPQPALARMLPEYAIRRDAEGQRCSVVLAPVAQGSLAAPRLALTATRGSESVVLGAVAPGLGNVEFVANNQREPFRGLSAEDPAALARLPAWRRFDQLAQDGRAFHLTGRDASGAVHSSRYAPIPTEDLLRVLAEGCGYAARGLALSSPAAQAEAEAALGLTEADLRHIRWVLAAEIDPEGSDPGDFAMLNATDRDRIAAYSARLGEGGGRYLTRGLADRLLAQPFRPLPIPARLLGVEVTPLRDWLLFQDADRTLCEITTFATGAEGLDSYRAPRMRFMATRDAKGDLMVIDLVSPNPFTAAPKAVVDGRGYALSFDAASGSIKPGLLPGNVLSTDILVALRRGEELSISGPGVAGPVTLRFSARGFAAAFGAMMQTCKRPGLESWLR